MKTEIIIDGVKYNLDIQKAKEIGVLKEKDTRCKSWEEFTLKYKNSRGYYYESTISKMHNPLNPCSGTEQLTQQEAIAIQAFSKLLKLRRDWIGDWNPIWNNNNYDIKYCVKFVSNTLCIRPWETCSHSFSFPTEEMAQEFLENFNDLFNQCKNIL